MVSPSAAPLRGACQSKAAASGTCRCCSSAWRGRHMPATVGRQPSQTRCRCRWRTATPRTLSSGCAAAATQNGTAALAGSSRCCSGLEVHFCCFCLPPDPHLTSHTTWTFVGTQHPCLTGCQAGCRKHTSAGWDTGFFFTLSAANAAEFEAINWFCVSHPDSYLGNVGSQAGDAARTPECLSAAP